MCIIWHEHPLPIVWDRGHFWPHCWRHAACVFCHFSCNASQMEKTAWFIVNLIISNRRKKVQFGICSFHDLSLIPLKLKKGRRSSRDYIISSCKALWSTASGWLSMKETWKLLVGVGRRATIVAWTRSKCLYEISHGILAIIHCSVRFCSYKVSWGDNVSFIVITIVVVIIIEASSHPSPGFIRFGVKHVVEVVFICGPRLMPHACILRLAYLSVAECC